MSEYVLHQTSVQSRHAIYPDVRVGDPKSDSDAPPTPAHDASAGDSSPNSPQLVHSLLKVRNPPSRLPCISHCVENPLFVLLKN